MPARCHYFFSVRPPATPYFYTLSLHDALPILGMRLNLPLHTKRLASLHLCEAKALLRIRHANPGHDLFERLMQDRKSTRLNSSHLVISYAVFCLKNKTFIHARML